MRSTLSGLQAKGSCPLFTPALDLDADARCLIGLPECRSRATRVLERHPDFTEDDAWAAVVSGYLDVVATLCGRLYAAYWRFIATRLQPILSHPLFAVHLVMSEDEEREAVLEPMSTYFLNSLRTLESDPNALRTDSVSERRLRVRPFGWSPVNDPLDGSLSLLIMRQGRHMWWPNAFMYSPLAYHLRSAGLAQVVSVERIVCRNCKKDFSARCLAGRCPECYGSLTVRVSKYLLSTRHIENHIRKGAARSASGGPPNAIQCVWGTLAAEPVVTRAAKDIGARPGEVGPSEHAECLDELRRDMVIALERAKSLWLKVMKRSRRSACAIAVLLSLAALEAVPEASAWVQASGGPQTQFIAFGGPEWLGKIVRELRRRSIRGDSVVTQAQLLLPGVLQAIGVTKHVSLTPGNVRVILCRLRKGLSARR